MAKICENLIEEITSGSEVLSQEMQSHVLTCPDCQQTISSVKNLKAARKGPTAKEAAAMASILTAVKTQAAASSAAAATSSAPGSSLVPVVALLVVVASAVLLFKPDSTSVAYKTDAGQEVMITSAEDLASGSAAVINGIDLDSGAESEFKNIDLPEKTSLKAASNSVFDHSDHGVTLLRGHLEVSADREGSEFVVETPLARMILKKGRAAIVASDKNLEITVLDGELVVERDEKGESSQILKKGQQWTISPEKDTIDSVGTLIVSPDQEDLTEKKNQ